MGVVKPHSSYVPYTNCSFDAPGIEGRVVALLVLMPLRKLNLLMNDESAGRYNCLGFARLKRYLELGDDVALTL